MLIDEKEVLNIAENKPGLIFYRDYYDLKPTNQGGNKYLMTVKKMLKKHGYICHEQRKRSLWNCEYSGIYTHFHKPD